jgi:DNA-binding IclR family transcriptional regulator
MLRVLQAFTEHRHTRSVADLATELALPTSTVYRFLSVLREAGLVEDARRGQYRLSGLVIGLGRAAHAAGERLLEIARPVVESVCDASGETTLLITRVRTSAICLDRVESPHPVRLQFDIGQRMSLHRGSASRVLLASMPARERRAYLDTVQPGQDERALLDADVAAVDREGWLQSFGEVDEGIWGVAAAIREEGRIGAALGLAGPLYRLQEPERERGIQLVVEGARKITEDIANMS